MESEINDTIAMVMRTDGLPLKANNSETFITRKMEECFFVVVVQQDASGYRVF